MDEKNLIPIPTIEQTIPCQAISCLNFTNKGDYCPFHAKEILGVEVKLSHLPDENVGLGLFATKDFKKNHIICEYKGKLISLKEFLTPENYNNYTVSLRGNIFISALYSTDGFGRYANSSYMKDTERKQNAYLFSGYQCLSSITNKEEKNKLKSHLKPNQVYLLSKRFIKAGEEIYVNYGKEYWVDFFKKN